MVIRGNRYQNEVSIFRIELQLLESGSSEMINFKEMFDVPTSQNIS